jgi:pterin-4a-carbinolamine dehydratase
VQVSSENAVTVELSSLEARGVTENDFIIAAKVDALTLTDLLVAAKKRTYYF